jgi:hypothetical protein
METSLVGVQRKIERADKHFNEIDSTIEALLSAEANAARTAPVEYQPERKHLVVSHPKTKAIDPMLPLVIGDCIHNFRSALDHLSFQLAVANNKGAEAEAHISFPICLSQKEFDSIAKKRLAPFIDGKALAAIQELQPYQTGRADCDPLWVLSQLDIIDKHRLLVVITRRLRPTGFVVKLATGEHFATQIDSDWQPMEDGAEIIRFDLSRVIYAEGEMQVKVDVSAQVCFKDTDLFCDGREVRGVLATLRREVNSIVGDFGVRFFG